MSSTPSHNNISDEKTHDMDTEVKQAGSADGSIQENNNGEKEVLTAELTLRSGLAVAGAAISYFLSVGFINAFGIFQQYYTAVYLKGKSDFQISWLGSFAVFCIFAFAPAAGVLADKIGPQIPIACGSVCILIAIFMVSLCTKYYQFFLAQGVLLGIGMSFVAIPSSGMVPRYFKRNRGLATGISVAGSSLGGVLWPIIFDQLLHHDRVDFPWAMRIAGFIMLPLLGICIMTVRPPLKPQTQPEENAEAGSSSPAEEHTKPAEKKKDLSVLRQPPFVLLCAGLFLAIFGFFTPFFFISTYAVHLGMSSSLAFYLVSILNAASLFGRILPGIVSDRLGRFNMMAVSAFFAAIVAFTWTTCTSVAGLVVWTLAFGFASGAILSLQLACATTLADAESAGAVVGAVMGSTSLSTLFGTAIAGQLIKYGYLALACWSGATLLAGAVLITLSRLAQDRRLIARV